MKPRRSSAIAIGGLVVAVALVGWLGDHRPPPLGRRLTGQLVVTSANDSGPGSLRDALFVAARSPQRARILVAAPAVVLRRPLPPLSNPRGVVIVGKPRTLIDGRALGAAPLIDVDAPGSVIEGLRLIAGEGDVLRVRATDVRLLDLGIEGRGVGIQALDGAHHLTVRGCELHGNVIGIRVAADSLPASIEGNRFRSHPRAALWVVGPDRPLVAGGRLTVRTNNFAQGEIGVVVGNVDAEVAANTFEAPTRAAIQLFGSGARVTANHVDGARQLGIVAEGTTESTFIGDNEIRDTAAIGILTRSARGTTVRGNRLYLNGHGIADVLSDLTRPVVISDNLLISHTADALVVIGSSPLIRGNRAVRNRGAAVRSLTLIDTRGVSTDSNARLLDNQFEGNGHDGVVPGVYRVRREEEEGHEPPALATRRGLTP